MIVCSCRAVNDTTIRSAILSGATCPDSVAERCGAGTDCGTCVMTIEDLLDEHAVRLDVRGEPGAAA